MRRSAALLGLWIAACVSETPTPSDTGIGPDGGEGDGPTPDERLARGRHAFLSLRCANCHGVDGRGDPTRPGAPIIVGRSAADIDQIVRVPCADPLSLSCHPLKIPDLADEVVDDIAYFLFSLANDPGAMPDPGPACSDAPSSICTFAGTGISGNKRDGPHLARDQHLFWPQNVAVDGEGRPVIGDWNNHLVRRVQKSGCIDGDCPIINLVGTGDVGDDCTSVAAPLLAKEARMNHQVGAGITEAGNLVLFGFHEWKIKYAALEPTGELGELHCLFGNERGFSGDGMAAGYDFDGQKGPTRLNLPSSAVRDRLGNWYIADQANRRIRVVRPDADDLPESAGAAAFVASLQNNIIETFAGGEPRTPSGEHRSTKPDYSDSGDGGPVSAATFRVQANFDALPQLRLALDPDRDLLYVADAENHRVRVIDLARAPPTIDVYAGGGLDVLADSITATAAKLFRPGDVDLVPDGTGDLVVTDTGHHCVRIVERATKLIRTLAGVCGGEGGYGGDGGPALSAILSEPGGAGIGADRTLFIADTLNHRVRRVSP